jgi:threonine/homoserine/homoserine lactone efflux protein
MPAESIEGFWAVTLLLIFSPGPDWAYTLGVAVGGGRVVPAVAGLVAGYVGLTLVVAAGVGAVVAGDAGVLSALSAVGGAYLLWLGVTTLRTAGHARFAAAPSAQTARATFFRGVGVSGLNPKGLLVFLALLPQFVDRSGQWPVAVQMLTLGVVFTVSCAVVYSGVGVFARTMLSAKPHAARAIARLSGAAMIVLGSALLVERFA